MTLCDTSNTAMTILNMLHIFRKNICSHCNDWNGLSKRILAASDCSGSFQTVHVRHLQIHQDFRRTWHNGADLQAKYQLAVKPSQRNADDFQFSNCGMQIGHRDFFLQNHVAEELIIRCQIRAAVVVVLPLGTTAET